MTVKELTSAILKRLEEGTKEIYSRYSRLASASAEEYKSRREELEESYRADANEVSARAKIDLNNTLEKMADGGYVGSGAAVQARLSSNAAKLGALSRLASVRRKGENELNKEELSAAAALQSNAEAEISKLKDAANSEIRQAEKEEEERLEKEALLAYERAEKAKQQEFENRLATEKLNLEKEKLEISRSASAEKEKENEEFRPTKSVYDYFDDVVRQNTKTKIESGKKYTYVNKKAVIEAIGELVQNESISRSYRYEMYLYAKSLGYTAN